jgi:transposase
MILGCARPEGRLARRPDRLRPAGGARRSGDLRPTRFTAFGRLSHKPARWTEVPSGPSARIALIQASAQEAIVAHNFLACQRDQELLLAPNMRDWLAEDHLAWFLIDAVGQLDLSGFVAAYRADGRGRAAHDPQMMLTLVLYAYAKGERSARRIEARCHEDVAYRVICAGHLPDHATIARFRARHQAAIAELFTGVLALCAEAGLGAVGLIALDSTKLAANASARATRSHESIAREVEQMLAEAGQIDAAEDERLGQARGDELPPGLRARSERRERLQRAKRALEAEHAAREAAHQARLAARAERERAAGRKLAGRKPSPPDPETLAQARANTTDPDSRLCKTPTGFCQGYSAQAAANAQGVIVLAELATDIVDQQQLGPMLAATTAQLAQAGIGEPIGTVLADAGYFSEAQVEATQAMVGELLVATRTGSAPKRAKQLRGERPGPPAPRPGSARERMQALLQTERAAARYRRRGALIEPVFGDIKFNRRCERFLRRGRQACRSEWRLIAATHNLLRLWRHAAAGAG